MIKLAPIISLILLLSFSSLAFAGQISPEKKADIQRLLEITGSLELAKNAADLASQQMIDTIKKENPNVDPRVFTIISEETHKVISENMNAFIDRMVPIYDKYYTAEDIRGVVEFYGTPLGKKMLSVMPVAMQESIVAGQKWGGGLVPVLVERIAARLKVEGFN